MKKVNLSLININLLNVLHILFREKNTTSAARVLGISQSAVSHSLKKLRDIFDDDLLVSSYKGKTMQLTYFASILCKQLEETIRKMHILLNTKEFTPTSSDRQFRIALTDYTTYMLLPGIYVKLKEKAPNVSIEVFNLDTNHIQSQVELNEINIAIGDFDNITRSENLVFKHLFHDTIACALRDDHPVLSIGRKLSFENYSKYPSLIVSSLMRIGYKELFSKKDWKKRCKVSNLITHNSCMVFHALKESDLITLAPSKVILAFKSNGITMIEPEFIDSTANISICYSQTAMNDKGVQWLIEIIEEVAKNNC